MSEHPSVLQDGVGPEWDRWAQIQAPTVRRNFWNEPYAELYNWFPWLDRFYTQWEKDFDALPGWTWMVRNSPWLPLGICAVYLVFCYVGPKVMANRRPLDLRRALIAWNLGLSFFSFYGASRTVPHLLHNLYRYGFMYTMCYKPSMAYGAAACGFWTQAFVLSKIPELGDTIFIVLRKKPLIFLHWYHHMTVLLYCWHSYYEQTTYGLYFVSMNYTVHAIMYLYYGLAAMRIRLCPPYWITTLQISQMFIGIYVCAAGGYYIWKGETKYVSVPNFWAGVIMYSSYAALFLQYALGRFMTRKTRSGPAKTNGTNGTNGKLTNGTHAAVANGLKAGPELVANGKPAKKEL